MEAEKEGSTAARRWVLVTVGTGTFMSALDGSVVNTVLPVLADALGTDVAGIEWVTTVYLLVVSALLLSVGRLGDIRGHKKIYVAGFIAFIIGSALCGLAQSAPMLVALRVVQAVGAAMLFASSPAILTAAFPAARRGTALGAQATFTYLGLTAGPSLGGWLAHTLGWRSVFYVNIPVGLLALTLAIRVIAPDTVRARGVAEKFDMRGAVLFASGLTALLIALNQGHEWGWRSLATLTMVLVAVLLLTEFIRTETRHPDPMLDLSLFRIRLFSTSTVSALLNYTCVYGVVFVLPFLLIQSRGLNTQEAGLVLTAQPLLMAVVAPISGALSDRIGVRLPATAGMLILTVGLMLLASAAADGALQTIVIALALIGFGLGLFGSPNNSAIMGAAPSNRQGIAAGVLATARNVGMVMGVGLAGAIFTTVLSHSATGAAVATDAVALAEGVRMSLWAMSLVAAAGTVTSYLR